MKFRIEEADPFLHIDTIAKAMRRFYGKEPWGDYFICNSCFPPSRENFSIWWDGVVKKEEECAVCGHKSVDFWSDERVEAYFSIIQEKEGFVFTGAFSGDTLVGWIWGFKDFIDKEEAFRIDMIGVVEEYRRQEGLSNSLKQVLFVAKARFLWLRNNFLFKKALKAIQMPLVVHLFEELTRIVSNNYSHIMTYSHADATNIHRILRFAGFKKAEGLTFKRQRVLFSKLLRKV